MIRTNGIRKRNFTEKEWDLIENYSPCLIFDDREQFYPLNVGASILLKTQHPPSLKRFYKENPFHYFLKKLEVIVLNFLYGRPPVIYKLIRRWFLPISTAYYSGFRVKRAHKIIEYAVFYLSDISHIYDLEHVWVYLDGKDKPILVKGTQHGMVVHLYDSPEKMKFKGTHPLLIVSPGKHAHYTNRNQLHREILKRVNQNPGTGGLYPIQFFTPKTWEKLRKVYPGKRKIHHYYQKNYAITPSFRFSKYLIPRRKNHKKYGRIVPWCHLEREIPEIIHNYLEKIKSTPWNDLRSQFLLNK